MTAAPHSIGPTTYLDNFQARAFNRVGGNIRRHLSM